MLQTLGAITVNSPIKSVSAAKRRPNGRDYAKAKKDGGRNVLWKRLTSTIDDALREAKMLPPDQLDKAIAIMATCTKLTNPVSRLVFMGHLTVTQGMAARRYADIIRKFERYHVDKAIRSVPAQDIDRSRGGEDHEIERHLNNGTIDDYERRARRAKREYDKAITALNRYRDPETGRNAAKNILDDLCLSDIEPPSHYRQNVAAVLQSLASTFGVKEKR